jgi:hypothetical protein
VSFAAITLCGASQRVFIIAVVYFLIDSVRKLLDTHSYTIYKRITFLTDAAANISETSAASSDRTDSLTRQKYQRCSDERAVKTPQEMTEIASLCEFVYRATRNVTGRGRVMLGNV